MKKSCHFPVFKFFPLFFLLLHPCLFSSFVLANSILVDIREQSLETALHDLAANSGLQLYYQYHLVANKTAHPLKGSYPIDEALDIILKGTGLKYDYVNHNTIVLKKDDKKPFPPVATPRPAQPAVTVQIQPEQQYYPPPVLEEILISARRKSESLQHTPMSVTAIPGKELQKVSGQQLSAITNFAPNVITSLGQGGGSSALQLFIRGIGEVDYMLTTDPAVGLYVDGIYLARTPAANISTLGMQQVELLRGPQGTLFGKNAIGGAINITTSNPTGIPGYQVALAAGNHQATTINLSADSATFSNHWSMNGSFEYVDFGGWQTRESGGDGGEQHRTTARLGIQWAPSKDFVSRFKIDKIDQHQASYANVLVETNPSAYIMQAYREAGKTPLCCTPNDTTYSNANNPLGRDNIDGTGFSWTNRGFFSNGISLQSITGYRNSDVAFGQDYDHSSAEFYSFGDTIHHEQFSQEFQFDGTALDNRLDWLAGIYLFKEQGTDKSTLLITPELIESNDINIDLNFLSKTSQKVTSQALYFHFNFAITTKLDFSAGTRYTAEEKYFEKSTLRTTTGEPQFPGYSPTSANTCSDTGDPGLGSPFHCREDWEEFSPRLAFSYQYNDEVMLYLNASRGFRSGGFNGRPTSLSLVTAYSPEHLDTFEIGIKSELLDNTLRLNTSAYFNRYKNKQQTVSVALENTGGVFLAVSNASEATIDGFEIEAIALPSPHWTLHFSAGYTNAKFTEWQDEIKGDLSYRQFPHTPEWTANASTQYVVKLKNNGELLFDLNMNYKDKIYLDAENSEFLHAGKLTTLDLSLIYKPADSKWEFSLIGKNLNNDKEMLSGYNEYDFFGIVHANYNPPRQYYFQIKYTDF